MTDEGQRAGERRYVTLVFADLCDYTSLTERLDPEEADLIRGAFERTAIEVVQRHGGAVSQSYGDGVLAVFGLPIASEHDVRSALDATLELRARIQELQPPIELPAGCELGMHSGVHCGIVLVRRGDSLHGHFDFTGDVVNTAARLCSAAGRDEIVVSEAAMAGIEPFYEAEFVADLTLKGKRLSVPAYRLQKRSEVRTRFEASTRRGLTEFVDRHAELARLATTVHAAAESGTRTAGVAGGAGIGKTRILDEFTRRHAAEDVHAFRGTCESYGSIVPMQPIIQILRQAFKLRAEGPVDLTLNEFRRHCASLGAEVEAHADSLASIVALETGSRSQTGAAVQRTFVSGLCAWIRALRARLVVLVIDDWQWVDDLTHQVLRGVVRNVPRGLLLVLASREHSPDDVLLEGADLIQLTPLPIADSTRVIQSILPHAVEPGLTDDLYRRSGGNPLFLEELCRSIPRDLASGAVLERTHVPQTIHGLIQTRLQTLAPEELRVVRTASVIGNEFTIATLAEVSDEDVQPVLARLAAQDWIRDTAEPGTYRFKHGITREVVYESLLLGERKAIHARVAEQLLRRAADGSASVSHEALAHHFVHSGAHDNAAHHAELAGDKAAATAALDRARIQYGTALTELDRLPQDDGVKARWLAVSVKWARAWVYNQAPEQLTVLDRAKKHAEELGDWNTLGDLEQMGAWICYALGEQSRAIDYCRRGLALAERIGNPKLIAQLTSNLGQCHAAAGDYSAAVDLLTESMELKRRGARGRDGAVPVGFAYALATLATVHADEGRFQAASEAMTQALDAVRGKGSAIEASVLALAAMVELWRGDFARCTEQCARAASTAERIQGPYVFAMSQVMGSYSRFRSSGEPTELDSLCRAVKWLEARSMGLYLSMAYGCAAEACWLAGDRPRARAYANDALQRAAERDPFGEAVALRVLAAIAAEDEGAAAAEALFARADAAALRRGSRRESALNALWRARVLKRGDAAALAAARQTLAALGMSPDPGAG